jgi:hypothetical protein
MLCVVLWSGITHSSGVVPEERALQQCCSDDQNGHRQIFLPDSMPLRPMRRICHDRNRELNRDSTVRNLCLTTWAWPTCISGSLVLFHKYETIIWQLRTLTFIEFISTDSISSFVGEQNTKTHLRKNGNGKNQQILWSKCYGVCYGTRRFIAVLTRAYQWIPVLRELNGLVTIIKNKQKNIA